MRFDSNICAINVIVDEVLPDSQAEKIGLSKGDRIISVDNVVATSTARARHLLRVLEGDEGGTNSDAALVVERIDGSKETFQVKRGQLGVFLTDIAVK